MLRKCEKHFFFNKKNLLVGVTVATAVAIEEAVNIDEYFIALSLQLHWKLMDFQCNCKTPEGMEDALQTVMVQCELWTDNAEYNQYD